MQTTLGISLGRQAIGIALLSYGSLIKWNVHSFNQKKGKAKDKAVLHVIDQLVSKHEVRQVAIKIPNDLERYESITLLVAKINVMLEGRNLRARYYSLEDIKKMYSKGEKINKRMLMKLVLQKFQVLTLKYNLETTKNRSYYVRVFEAVAAGHLLSTTIKLKEKR